MIEANEVNSTFYALRLLSHGLDTSQIEVTDGEQYPASEFTREEQEQALKIIHRIEESEAVPFAQLPPDKIESYLTALAERIEESANRDLADAGYAMDLTTPSPSEPTQPEDFERAYIRSLIEETGLEKKTKKDLDRARLARDLGRRTRRTRI